ncbi:MAG: tetratricopeptide repeat protein [Verrucomicrobiota bacterium]
MKLISAAHIAIGIIITAVFQTAAEKPHAPTVAESLRTNAPAKAHGEQDCVAAVRAAIDEIKRGQTNQAAKALKGLAENGCADAELEYGVACWSGIGRSVDKAEAARWFGMAATNGNLIAMQRLGYAYREGEGVSRDLTKADFWTRKAASGGLAMAQRAMGQRCYDTGELEESRKWNELAAAQNDSKRSLIWRYCWKTASAARAIYDGQPTSTTQQPWPVTTGHRPIWALCR